LTQLNYIIIVCAVIWIIGVAALLVYSIISYLKITRRVSTATRLKNEEFIKSCNAIVKLRWPFEVYVSDQIESPFVCGILRSKIILPSFLFLKEDYEKELQHILLHEMVHIKRFDFILKPLAYMALIIHWFNPVMWIWFYLASKDMEMSCDEKVIKISRLDQRESYANTLLEISMKQNNLFAEGLLGFGESNIGERVKNIMKYKNPKMWVIAASILIIVIFGIVLLSNPMDDSVSNNEIISVLFMGAREADSGENTPVDSFVLMGYETSTGNLNILSIPRDTVIKDETKDTKLGNYAALHSSEQVIQALNNILGVNISKYIKIDTAAFRDFIDAIGGISYDVPQDMYYDDPMQGLHIDLKKGLQVLDGNKAEMLVRFRKGYSEGDLTRIDVQKEVLVAILTQKSGTDIFKNIGSLYDLVSNNIETNIDKKEIKKYSAIARKHSIQMEDIKEINLPFSVTLEDRISYIRIDEEEAQKLLKDEF
ncbi:MAG: M56 family metallopeptidase, partial [Anaerovorax sp.]|nr:M56 family metallopeptidase [Anaerovorax sp.]